MFTTLQTLREKQAKGFTHVVIADEQLQLKRKRVTRIVMKNQPVSFHRSLFPARGHKFVKSGQARYFTVAYAIGVYETYLAASTLVD